MPNGELKEHLDIEYRVVYDTPHYVQYDLIVWVDGEPVVLKSWSREKHSINAREMKDIDVYDLFSNSIEKYMKKITTDGMSIRTWNKLMKNNGFL